MKLTRFSILTLAILSMLFVLLVSSANAKFYLKTTIIDGTLNQINGSTIQVGSETYDAAPVIKTIPASVGDPVTIRYYVDVDGDNIYVQIKNGLGTIPRKSPPARDSMTELPE